ncbi:MAG: gliding motility-associated C-terminal domain-containing protein [Elusimicrobia bacterium]|nr:gliding motility-associated C-terminal domain-containing protein [Elusimicrobiota bacterium]
MLRTARPLSLSLILAAALVPAAAQAGSKLTGSGRNVLRNDSGVGGSPSAGGGFKLNARVGSVGNGSFSGGALRARAGLMHTAAQPGTVTELVAVSKSTGTLDLAWTAPGRDGFEGDVAGGFYRIDYSSSAGHLFSPTTYQLELATNVVAGSTQTYQLAGLEPNTTYYVKVYLADDRKYFAEDSRRLDESTLTNLPVDPFFSSVSFASVTVSWLLPAGGAGGGYGVDGSTTSFGGLFPGGAVTSSATPNGTLLSLTIGGLVSNTTYFFKIASLNWQGQKSYATVLSTRTRLSPFPLAVENLAAYPDDLARTVRLTWTSPLFENRQGVLVLFSTSPATGQVVDGTSFAPGQTLADASVVRSTRTVEEYTDGGLGLDTTYYYHVYAQGDAIAPYTYSVVVSTAIFLDLPPNSPVGLTSTVSADRSQVALSWKKVFTNSDGSVFHATAAPMGVELSGYELARSTSILNATWTTISTLPVTTAFYTEPIPDPDQVFFYRVTALDAFAKTGRSMVVDTDESFYVVAPDQVSQYKIPAALAAELSAASNKSGFDYMIRASSQAANGLERIFKAARFEVVKVPGGEAVPTFQFSKPHVELSLRYEVEGGVVVPEGFARGAGVAAAPAGSAIRAADADRSLGMYWDNNQKYVKLFGKVDTGAQMVRVQTSMLGNYQVRGLVRTGAFEFDLSGISNKAITPNGDGRNDQVVFLFDNPRDSAFSGEVFDVTGARVASMSAGPVSNSLQWDGRAGGRAVPGGVYVYQLRGEGKVFNGTVVVIR